MKRPKIGIALGSGASRGLAHIGVLKALEENNIPIDMVAGTSSGSMIGALYCAEANLKYIEKIAEDLPRSNIIDPSVPKQGLIKGNRIEELMRLLTKDKNIEELSIPYRAVAADLISGQKYVFDRGPVYRAVRASISIPGIFVPVYMDDMVLVDGGILDRVPVGVVREMGADIVIGVDVGFSSKKGKVDTIFDVIFQSMDTVEREILKGRIIEADILLKPYLPNIDPARFDCVYECSKEGYDITMAAIPKIKEIIDRKEKLNGQE